MDFALAPEDEKFRDELRAWLDTFWETALDRYADRVRQDSSPGTQT